MSEPKLISPLLDDFVMGAPISDHHGIRCCPAMPNHSDKRYFVKVISIPASQVQLDALLLAGAYSSQASALSYFKELAAGVVDEAEVLKKLSRFEGFLSYDGVQVVPMDDQVGYDVYLLSPYSRTLERHMRKNPMTHLNAVNLGLDLCASMVMCRRAGYLYVDLKPSNIFVNEKMEFRVGDLGFVKLDSLKYASLPDKYRSAYTAPELSDAWSSLNDTIDTYAIGMILYQVYNDGKLPFEGQAGQEALPPPAYADYEIAEIILKAVAPDPKDRWADPMQMGQALVAYMQRNSINDVPIIPLPEPVVEDPVPEEEPAPAEEPVAEEAVEPVQEPAPIGEQMEIPLPEPIPEESAEDPSAEEEAGEPAEEDPADLSFMDDMVSDDTAPSEDSADQIEYAEISDDTSDILAQVDELIAHETPEPVVAPEPIDIPIPAPITLEDEPAKELQETQDEPEEDLVILIPGDIKTDSGSPAGEVSEEQDTSNEEVPAPGASESKPEEAEAAGEDPFEDAYDVPVKPKRRIGLFIGILLLVVVLGLGAFGAYYYYNNYYLQTVYGLELQGSENYLEVHLTTDIDESLLKVVCTDTYGNTRTAAVENGKAVFEGLNPDTIYKVKVIIDGNHELRGDITDDYTTPSQTNIVRFDAVAGSEDGSVILNFTIDGRDSNTWTVTYTAEGENEKSVTFSGHLVTINGLTLNKQYTFTLSTESSLYIVGNNTVTYQSVPLVYAQDVDITACNDSGLTAVWTAPADTAVSSWTVRCYSDSGYDQSVITSENTAVFTDIDPTQAYTVEVIAEGMTVGTRDYVSANSATITGFTADTSVPLELTVRWDYTGVAPSNGWLVLYKEVGSDHHEVIQTTDDFVTIYPAMPGTSYELTLQASDGTTVFDGAYACDAGAVQVFSGYTVTADNMTFWMVRHPGYSGWSWRDVKRANYTNTFKPGEKAAFIIKLDKKYSTSSDIITSLFVVQDENGEVVCTSSSSSSWTYMWYQFYCELDIPTLPTKPGTYTMSVYFNGMAATQMEFTITDD